MYKRADTMGDGIAAGDTRRVFIKILHRTLGLVTPGNKDTRGGQRPNKPDINLTSALSLIRRGKFYQREAVSGVSSSLALLSRRNSLAEKWTSVVFPDFLRTMLIHTCPVYRGGSDFSKFHSLHRRIQGGFTVICDSVVLLGSV